MSKKSKRFLLSVGGVLLTSAVIAAAVPKNVVVFFLPVSDLAHTDSIHESKTAPTRSGALTSTVTNSLPSDAALKPNPRGIDASVGVSLYDKPAKWTNNQAADAVLSPAKVMILPPESLKTARKSKVFSKPREEVNGVQVRIYPLVKPAEAVKAEAKERPIIVTRYVYKDPPPEIDEGRPKKQEEWTDWILDRLKSCQGDKQTVLPTLYWMMANDKLAQGKSVCVMKHAVADYLRKCHPWTPVYYTPFNNDVPVSRPVQMGVEIIGTDFDKMDCSSIDLSNVNFEKADFAALDMKGVNFSGSFFKEAYFLNADFSETVFKGALLKNVLFKNVDLTGAFFKNAEMRFAHLHRTVAPMTNFDGAVLSNTQFRNVDVSLSSFQNAKMDNTAWQDVLAYRVDLSFADLRQAAFDNVLMEAAIADRAVMPELSCKKCMFKYLNLEHAALQKAVFDDVSFENANLEYADFSQALFTGKTVFDKARLYRAVFDDADIRGVSDVPLDKIRKIVVDKKTKTPLVYPDFDAAFYDEKLYREKLASAPFFCSRAVCDDVMLGKSSPHNMTVRAMTLLSYPPGDMNDKLWAICTLGCVAAHDKKLENAAIDILAEYVRKRRHWSARENLFKPIEPMTDDVDLALRTLTNPLLRRDLGHQIDLRMTDLRLADLENADLRNVNFAGSYLGGVNMKNAKTDAEYDNFDQTVIDEFTRLPDGMAAFQPYSLPDSEVPDWWKPATIRVLEHGSHIWNQITQDIPFVDDYVAKVREKSE